MIRDDKMIPENSTLIVVDVQNDFTDPKGSLYLKSSDAALPHINYWITVFDMLGYPIVYTQDWHDHEDKSFKEFGGEWPPHCIAMTWGARANKYLFKSSRGLLTRKGQDPDVEEYSAFVPPLGINSRFKRAEIERVYVVGVALDICVKHTALDAIKLGYITTIFPDATAATTHENGHKAIDEMIKAGVRIQY